MRLAVATGALMALIMAAVLSIGTAPTPVAAVAVAATPDRLPAGAVVKKHLRHLAVGSDSLSPPGCLRIVGQPPPASCLPCPPLWLGGPTVQCISILTTAAAAPPLTPAALCPISAGVIPGSLSASCCGWDAVACAALSPRSGGSARG